MNIVKGDRDLVDGKLQRMNQTSALPGGAVPCNRSVLFLLAASLLIAIGVVAIAAGASRIAYGSVYSMRALSSDAVLFFIPALLMLWAVRSVWRVGVVLLPVAALVIAGQAASRAMLAAPLRLSDLGALPTLMSVLPVWGSVSILIASILVLAGLFWLLRSPWPRWLVLFIGLVVLGTGFAQGGWGHHAALWLTSGESREPSRAGSLLFLLSENAGRQVVGKDAVSRIAGNAAWSLSYVGAKRNIHLVLLETFWDPSRLTHYRFSQDPFDPRFRKLMEASGASMALTPHFGHLTANAEFESLCGLPAPDDGAIFVNSLRNHMPCLPRILEALGYSTQASHANVSTSWSRDKAYDLLGFSRFYAGRSFEIDDTDALFLTDASFYRQNALTLDEAHNAKPIFNYLVSLSSHWPYKRDKTRRPDVVEVSPENAQLKDFVNGLHYSSAAFSDWVEEIRKRDPDALIVAYGDHAPVMPPRQDVYIDSGFDMGNHMRLSDDQLLQLAGTPLLVIDGRKGIVPVGIMPVSGIADLILDKAFGGAVQLPQTQAIRASIGRDLQVRSYLDRMLVENDGVWNSCNVDVGKDSRQAPPVPASPVEASICDDGHRMLQEGVLLRDDLSEGNSYFVDAIRIPEAVSEDDGQLQMPSAGCGIDVANFGPKNIVLGTGFNVQRISGKSAFWFNLTRRVGRPGIRVGNDVVKLEVNGLFAAAGFDNPTFVHEAGTYEVFVVCDGHQDVSVGTVQVAAPGNARQEAPKVSLSDMRQSLPLERIGEAPSRLRIEAWMSPEVCKSGKDWRGPVLVKWTATGASSVRVSVRSSGEDAYKLWSSGTASGQALTGDWGRDGMQIRVDADGKRVGEFALNGAECRQ